MACSKSRSWCSYTMWMLGTARYGVIWMASRGILKWFRILLTCYSLIVESMNKVNEIESTRLEHMLYLKDRKVIKMKGTPTWSCVTYLKDNKPVKMLPWFHLLCFSFVTRRWWDNGTRLDQYIFLRNKILLISHNYINIVKLS